MRNRSLVSLAVSAVTLVVVLLSLPSGVRPAGAAKVVGPPETAWKDLTDSQKRNFMKKVVMPKTKPIFRTFDAKKFKNFTCETCHGKNADDRKYKMPSPDIHPLPGTPEAFEAKMKEEPTWPKWTKFMGEEVEPTVGKLLGKPLFDPKNPKVEGAFGCNGCHKIEMPAAAKK